jgi:hypothetical protein
MKRLTLDDPDLHKKIFGLSFDDTFQILYQGLRKRKELDCTYLELRTKVKRKLRQREIYLKDFNFDEHAPIVFRYMNEENDCKS